MLFLRQRLALCIFSLDLLSQGIDLAHNEQAFVFQFGDLFCQQIATLLVGAQLQRLIIRDRRMGNRSAQWTWLSGLQQRALRFQTFDFLFLLAERFNILVVLFFFFVLLATLLQRGIKRGLIGLRF